MSVLRHRVRELADEQSVLSLTSAWRSSAAADEELQRAFSRYQSTKAARASRRAVVLPPGAGWLNLAYGFGAAAAILLVIEILPTTPAPDERRDVPQMAALDQPSLPSAVTSADRTVPSAPQRERFSARIERGGVVVSAQPGMEYEVEAGQQVIVALGEERYPLQGPVLIELQFASDTASGWRMVLKRSPSKDPEGASRSGRATPESARPGPVPQVANAQAPPAMDPAPASSVAELWTEAARAMREGEHASAEQALDRLSQEGSPQTQDAALLALAQLWQSRRDPRAAPILKRLAETGATALVRRRAGELLATP